MTNTQILNNAATLQIEQVADDAWTFDGILHSYEVALLADGSYEMVARNKETGQEWNFEDANSGDEVAFWILMSEKEEDFSDEWEAFDAAYPVRG